MDKHIHAYVKQSPSLFPVWVYVFDVTDCNFSYRALQLCIVCHNVHDHTYMHVQCISVHNVCICKYVGTE